MSAERPRKIVVTGAAGSSGQVVVPHLAEGGTEVHAATHALREVRDKEFQVLNRSDVVSVSQSLGTAIPGVSGIAGGRGKAVRPS